MKIDWTDYYKGKNYRQAMYFDSPTKANIMICKEDKKWTIMAVGRGHIKGFLTAQHAMSYAELNLADKQ